ncbi:MAG: photosystem I reaction center subunit PsaK [Cyanobacteria bacterium J06635_15]
MFYLPTLLEIVPRTVAWSPAVGIVMVLCNVLAIALGKIAIKYPSADGALPSPYFGGMGFASLLGVTSLGHVIGLGTIIGLATVGVL